MLITRTAWLRQAFLDFDDAVNTAENNGLVIREIYRQRGWLGRYVLQAVLDDPKTMTPADAAAVAAQLRAKADRLGGIARPPTGG